MPGRGQSVCVWLLVIMQCHLVAEAFTSEGREFVFGFPDAQYRGTGQIEVIISTTSRKAVSVTVSVPLQNWYQTVIVTAVKSQTVVLPDSAQGHSFKVADKGVHVVASDPVTVTGVTKMFSMTDTFLAIPYQLLGQEYFLVTYSIQPECMMVATADNTKILLPFIFPIFTYGPHFPSGPHMQISLNKFQSFHMHHDSENFDYTGLRVVSTKPIAVVCGNRYTYIGSYFWDHTVTMLYPTDMLGTRYYPSHTPNMQQGDLIRIVGLRDETTVTYGEQTFTIRRAGNGWQINVPANIWRPVTSDKPVMVAMFSKSYLSGGHQAGDPSLMLLSPVKLYGKRVSWKAPVDLHGPGHFNDSLSVVIKERYVSGLTLDGRSDLRWTTHANFESSDMVNLAMNIGSGGTHMLSHQDPKAKYFAFLSGITDTAHVTSYLSPAGFGTVEHRCSISGDPHLSTMTGQKAPLSMPCAFVVARFRLNNIDTPLNPWPRIPEMKIEVVGGNDKEPINGRTYVSEVCVTSSAGDRTNTFCTGKKLIANGTYWTNETGDMLSDRVVLDYNTATKEAIFTIKDTFFVLRFRPANRQQSNFQHRKPGIFIKVDSRRFIYDPSVQFPTTMCSTTDDYDSIATEAAKEKVDPMFMGMFAMMKHMQSNIETGSQDEQCPNFVPALAECNKNQRVRAVNECFALLKFANYVKCFVANQIKPSRAFLDCLDFICSSGATGCPAMTSHASLCPDIRIHVNLKACPSV